VNFLAGFLISSFGMVSLLVGGHGFDIVGHYCAVDNFFPSSKDP
jgi:hypothetical protein